MENKLVTNWVNSLDWKQVVENGYSNDLEANRKALSSIIAWEARDSNVVPSPLICLKELLLAKVCQIDKQKATVDQLQLYQYNLSMSVIRFVNFITEPHQKGLFARAIKTIASEIGIPDWIVNLRHNATHFTLPSIEILEEAREFLFKWLKEHYVDTYKEYTVEKFVLDNVKTEISNILSNYMDIRRIKKTKKGKNKNKERKVTQIVQTLDDKLDLFIANFKSQTFYVLLSDGFMIPTKDQLASFGIIAEEFLEQESIEIPESIFSIWELFLDHCSKNELIGILFDNLMQSYKSKSTFNSNRDDIQICLRNRFLLGWILCLIKLQISKGNGYKFELNWKEVLLSILQSNPSVYSYLFLREVSQLAQIRTSINLNKLEKLQKLVQVAYLDNQTNENTVRILTHESENPKEYIKAIYDYEPLRLQINENSNKVNIHSYFKAIQKNDTVWKLIDDDDWNHENLKLGLVEGQTCSNLNLDLRRFLENQNTIETECQQTNILPSLNGKRKISQTGFSYDQVEQLKKSVLMNYWKISQQ